jgi:two-component sensor histidine kinase
MIKKKNTWWFLFVFIFCTVQNGFTQQTQEQLVDSVELSFEQYSGKERISKIADYIRWMNVNTYNPKSFSPYLPELYDWIAEHPDAKLLNTIRLAHVNLLLAGRKRGEATELLFEILHDGETLPVNDSISVYTFLYEIYSFIGAFSKSWEILKIKDNILDRHSSDDSFFKPFKNISDADLGLTYLRGGNYEKAVSHFKIFIEKLNFQNKPIFTAGAWNNLGLTYLKLNKPDSAIFSFKRALSTWDIYMISNESQDSAFTDLLNGNIGEAFNQKKMYSKALPLLQQHVETSVKNNYLTGIIDGLNEIGVAYIGLGDPNRALEVLDSAAQTLQLYTYISGRSKNMETRIIALEKANRPQEALNLLRKNIAFEDSILQIGDRARTAILEIEYEVDKKNTEIARQKIKLLEARAEGEKQNRIQWTFTVGLILMLVIVILLVISRIQRIKIVRQLGEKNRLIGEQNNAIENALSEKETLLKEIHHRVKNNLQLVSGMLELQAVKIDDKKVRDNLQAGQKRLKSMSLIHELLYSGDNLGTIDFKEYVSKLTNDIAIAFGDKKKKIDFHFEIKDVRFEVNTAVPLGLIITELITNTYRHAFIKKRKGNIYLKLKEKENGDFQLIIRDDGKGMPKGFDYNKVSSLGMRLVNGLTRQLEGKLDIQNGKGTTIIINFKDIHEHE